MMPVLGFLCPRFSLGFAHSHEVMNDQMSIKSSSEVGDLMRVSIKTAFLV
jgi:hypothetical protein